MGGPVASDGSKSLATVLTSALESQDQRPQTMVAAENTIKPCETRINTTLFGIGFHGFLFALPPFGGIAA